MDEKNTALRNLMVTNFAVAEIAMFLDTHPNDRNALSDYHKYSMQLKERVQEYTRQYGPLTQDMVISTTYWDWVKNPWPWEQNKEDMV